MGPVVARTILLTGALLAPAFGAAQDPPAVPERVPWTSSRLTGSPEPPPPLQAVRAFPRLTFRKPVHLVPFPDHSRYVLIEEEGKLWTFRNDRACEKPDLLIDLRAEVRGLDRIPGCRGVDSCYALAFDPDFARNRFCYVMYVLGSKDRRRPLPEGSRVSRFRVTDADPPRLDPASEEVLLTWLAGGHNGCDLQFGNDGFLYISTGDATDPSPPDRLLTGQNVGDLLSSVLRIDVRRPEGGRPYAVPPDNPFVNVPGARPEIWCYGLRNPWRMSFDRATGRLWLGDVGWERWELVICAERGGNYGWAVMEGPAPCLPSAPRGPTPILPPADALPHPEAASITGGFVYRGRRLADFRGWYFYGDWETRRVWANPVRGNALGERREVARTGARIVAFAEEADGELLLLDYEGGGIHRLEPRDASARNVEFPRLLSATGLFESVRDQTPAPGVVPYSVRVPRWADGASARRWIAIPGRDPIRHVDKNQQWPRESVWPRDSVLAKTLALDGRNVETQILHYDGQSWNAYAYVWNEAQTDAALAPAQGAEIDLGGGRRWRVPARAACLTCHNPWPGYALSFTPAQLDLPWNGIPASQLEVFRRWGFLPTPLPRYAPLADPTDETAPLDARARSYLAANCAHCHRFGGGGSARIDLRHDIPLADCRVLGERPALGTFDLPDPYVVAGGDPARSVLLYRVSKLGHGRMPHLGSEVVDPRGVALLARWIASLPPTPASPPAEALRSEERRALERARSGDKASLARLLAAPSGALDLLLTLPELSEDVRHDAVRRALELPAGPVRDLFERFEPPERRRERLGPSVRPERILGISGDPARGRALFANPSLQCARCHRVGPGPETLGPDLSGVGSRLGRAPILEAILDPSKTVDPKYAGVTLRTRRGEVLSGIVVRRTERELVLRDVEKEVTLAAGDVEAMAPQTKSLMPEGLLQHLTAQEAADLLAFLESLR